MTHNVGGKAFLIHRLRWIKTFTLRTVHSLIRPEGGFRTWHIVERQLRCRPQNYTGINQSCAQQKPNCHPYFSTERWWISHVFHDYIGLVQYTMKGLYLWNLFSHIATMTGSRADRTTRFLMVPGWIAFTILLIKSDWPYACQAYATAS